MNLRQVDAEDRMQCGPRIEGRSIGRPVSMTSRRQPAHGFGCSVSKGFVTLPCRECEVSAPQELLGRCDCSPPRCHRDTAKRAVRLGGDEMALDVEGVVDGVG